MKMDYPRKVNFQEYENSFNYYWWKKFVDGQLQFFNTEIMRGLLYGYTFTEDYKKGIIPDALSVDYWEEKNKNRHRVNPQIVERITGSLWERMGQGFMICEAIGSTGDGTLEQPYCVICVGHEYEYLRSHRPSMRVVSQRLLPGHIDCLELEGEEGYTETIHFDISRWFERRKDK
jgi:hypothetical protein